jgi:Importin-beta N-terminal domain
MERLFDILTNCISDPQYLSKASEILREFENAKGYAPTLIVILNSNVQKPVQVLAGILLKNLLTDNWDKLSKEDRVSAKKGILSSLKLPDPKLRNLIV